MYRPASRYESRPLLEKPSRSARSTWVDPLDRSFAPTVEVDGRGLSRDPYLSGDALGLEREFQLPNSHSNDLREAQRLAASFFSQYPPSSTSAAPVYREALRTARPPSPEIPMERYSGRGQFREAVGEERWADRVGKDPLFSSRSQILPEDWEEDRNPVDRRERVDVYGVPVPAGRQREDGGWDDYDHGVIRQEGLLPDPEGPRVPKRLDWTGLLPADAGRREVGMSLDTSLSNRANPNYRGGLPLLDSHRNGLDHELVPEDPLFPRRGVQLGDQYRDLEVLKERGYLDERLHEREEYGVGRSVGSRRDGLGGRVRDEWAAERELSIGRGPRGSDPGRGVVRFDEDRDPRRPFLSARHAGGGSGSGLVRERDIDEVTAFRRGKYDVPKRDFSNRASITNRDILAVYYGNESQPRNFPQRRNFPILDPLRHISDPIRRSEKWRPAIAPSGPPLSGRSGRRNTEPSDPSRKGKKRWDKSAPESGDTKRFKRETKSDKLFLMHNSRVATEEQGKNSTKVAADKEAEKATPTEEKKKEPEAEGEKQQPAVEGEKKDPAEPTNGLWDNDDSWSDSGDEEKAAGGSWDGPSTDGAAGKSRATDEEREQAAFQALQSAALNDSKNFLGECSEDDDEDDDDAGWESLASDLDDQLDDVCVHQGTEAAGTIIANSDNLGVVPIASSEAQASEENGRVRTLSVAQSQDSEMVEVDIIERSEEGKEAPKVHTSLREGKESGEKVVVIMEKLQESVKNREDKAFDYYVSLFEQDTQLMKLYEANVNCGSFECLVCAGIGAKKKKRFPDVASLVQHAKKILRTKKLPEHRGFARAVCKILGWETAAGPSVILPRGCIPPPQGSEPKTTHSGSSVKQKGGRNAVVGGDWEWAAARKLFEEQEGRIDTTCTPPVVLPTGNVSVSRSLLPSEGKSPDTDSVAAKTTKLSEAVTPAENATALSERDSTTIVDFSMSEQASGVEAVSVSDQITGVESVLPLNHVSMVDNSLVTEKVTVVESSLVVEKAAVVSSFLVPDNTPVVQSENAARFGSMCVAGKDAIVESNCMSEKVVVTEISELVTNVLAFEGEKEMVLSSSKLSIEEVEVDTSETLAPLSEEGTSSDPFQVRRVDTIRESEGVVRGSSKLVETTVELSLNEAVAVSKDVDLPVMSLSQPDPRLASDTLMADVLDGGMSAEAVSQALPVPDKEAGTVSEALQTPGKESETSA